MKDEKYLEEQLPAVRENLGAKGIVFRNHDDFYSGPEISEALGGKFPTDTFYMRLGRESAPGHQSYTFKSSQEIFLSDNHGVLIPYTRENIEAIKSGKDITYFVLEELAEEGKYIAGFKHFSSSTGDLNSLINYMPKEWISRVGKTTVRIGRKTIEDVLSSNENDGGEVLIESASRKSSVIYNPSRKDLPRPNFTWGSFGWKNPIKVYTDGNDALLFDERTQQNGRLWRLDFSSDGYVAKDVQAGE